MFERIVQILKSKLFLMIPNGEASKRSETLVMQATQVKWIRCESESEICKARTDGQ